MRLRPGLLVASLLAVAQAAGATTLAAPATTPPTPLSSPAQALPWPATPAELATTSAEVYLGNLDERIATLQRLVQEDPQVARQVALAGALYHRYRIRARLDDAEAALALLDRALAIAPRDLQALRLRAGVRAGFHRFDEARADLDAAVRAGADQATLAESRREIALATGRYEEVATALATSARTEGDLYERAFRGNLRLLQGDLEGAGAQFRLAQAASTDSSPLPLAWLHVQQGIALLRAGQAAQANRFFRAAHERLPGYTLATEHLAETEVLLGRLDAARALYDEVIGDTGSPEFLHALSRLERQAGNLKRAEALDARAAEGWRALLARHPQAFAQHAIAFYLDRDDAGRALELARTNIALRQDVLSWILLARAATAAGNTTLACQATVAADATGLQPPERAALPSARPECARIAAMPSGDRR